MTEAIRAAISPGEMDRGEQSGGRRDGSRRRAAAGGDGDVASRRRARSRSTVRTSSPRASDGSAAVAGGHGGGGAPRSGGAGGRPAVWPGGPGSKTPGPFRWPSRARSRPPLPGPPTPTGAGAGRGPARAPRCRPAHAEPDAGRRWLDLTWTEPARPGGTPPTVFCCAEHRPRPARDPGGGRHHLVLGPGGGQSQAAGSPAGCGTLRGPNRRPWTRATPSTTTRPPMTRRSEKGSSRTTTPRATATRGTR